MVQSFFEKKYIRYHELENKYTLVWRKVFLKKEDE